MLPPFGPGAAGDLDTLVLFLSKVANSVNLPFYYYHYPESSGVQINTPDFLALAMHKIPSFAGIKFVDTAAFTDFITCLTVSNR